MEIAWSLVLFTALTGCGGWLLAAVAANEFSGKAMRVDFPAAALSLALLAAGGLASVTHLAHPENMLAALTHPTSGIFIEAMLVGIAAAFAFAYLVAYGRSRSVRRVCAAGGAVFGVALSFMAGHSYLMSAVATWNTMLLPLAYLGTAMASGIALYVAVASMRRDAEGLRLHRVLLIASGAIATVTCLLYAVHIASSGGAMIAAVVAAAVGGLAPLALGFAALKRPGASAALPAASFICAFAGAVCLRAAMWAAYVPLENFFGLTM